MADKLTVAVISGGTSGERAISEKGARQVLSELNPDRYAVRQYDPRTDLSELARAAGEIDVALVILHGINGEDGTVQGFLDLLGIPYQCAGVLGSALAMNKLISKFFYEKAGIRVPGYIGLQKGDPVDVETFAGRLGLPVVVKPASGGSSLGMGIARSESELPGAIAAAFDHDDTILLEQYLSGTEITGAVIGNASAEALPIVEIVPENSHEFFDFEAKYNGRTREICPARIDEIKTAEARGLAVSAHRALFCSGCSRTDMIISDGGIYVLETNTIPGMTENSLLPLAAETAGMTYGDLLDRLIGLALEKKAADPAADRAGHFSNQNN